MEEFTAEKWQQKENETPELFSVRIELQTNTWRDTVKKRGNLYLVKFTEDDIRPMWEDQISGKILSQAIPSPALTPYDCPLCQPYDYFDTHLGRYTERRYLTRIVDPRYPEGFIDKPGVWIKCPCLVKGEKRKWLKFKEMRSQ